MILEYFAPHYLTILKIIALIKMEKAIALFLTVTGDPGKLTLFSVQGDLAIALLLAWLWHHVAWQAASCTEATALNSCCLIWKLCLGWIGIIKWTRNTGLSQKQSWLTQYLWKMLLLDTHFWVCHIYYLCAL